MASMIHPLVIKKSLYLALFTAVFLFCLHASAQWWATPISLTENSSMDFGTIHILSSGDTITLSPNGSVNSMNGSLLSGSTSAANYRITGRRNRRVSISFSSGDTLTGPGGTIAIGSFTHNQGNSPRFNRQGELILDVGATLTIGPGQMGGSYSGTYAITVDYN